MTPDLRAAFARGLSYAEFAACAKRYPERLKAVHGALRVPDDRAAPFQRRVAVCGGALHALVLAEDWCADTVRALPLLDRLCACVPGMDARVLPSDGEPLAAHWPLAGQIAIPIVVFLDVDFREVGHWIETSRAMAAHKRAQREAHADLPAGMYARTVARRYDEAFVNAYWSSFLDEWLDALERGRP